MIGVAITPDSPHEQTNREEIIMIMIIIIINVKNLFDLLLSIRVMTDDLH